MRSRGSKKNAVARRCFRDVESVQYIVNVLQSTSHNGFPVVEPLPRGEDDEYDPSSGGPSRSGVFKGIILRSQLLVLLESEARSVPCPSCRPK